MRSAVSPPACHRFVTSLQPPCHRLATALPPPRCPLVAIFFLLSRYPFITFLTPTIVVFGYLLAVLVRPSRSSYPATLQPQRATYISHARTHTHNYRTFKGDRICFDVQRADAHSGPGSWRKRFCELSARNRFVSVRASVLRCVASKQSTPVSPAGTAVGAGHSLALNP